ncbi:MAG: ribosome small subunit-dependent GTPase A [Cyclobacteriaceae bacterium]
MKGRVMKSTGSWYLVRTEYGDDYSCRIRGRLRLEGSRETNPVAVGDMVEFEPEGQEGSITEIHPRRNHIIRQAARKSAQTQVLAANVDQALLIVTVAQPRTSSGFIDRFLITCQAYDIPQIILINKSDLWSQEDRESAESWRSVYASLNISVIVTSLKDEALSPEILDLLKNKTTLVAGHSGTGKSTLVNLVLPQTDRKTGEISSFSEKGVHTTTFAEIFSGDDGLFIIDTPGIKEWGLTGFEPQELSGFFPEMEAIRNYCRFGGSCLHIHEPHCAVLAAVERGEIALSRYESYFSMVAGEDNRK